MQGSPAEMYTQWVDRLNVWLELEGEDRTGNQARQWKKQGRSLTVNLKAAKMINLNRAHKCNQWWIELDNIVRRGERDTEAHY